MIPHQPAREPPKEHRSAQRTAGAGRSSPSRTYVVTVVGDLPDDLQGRVSALHASAVLQATGATKADRNTEGAPTTHKSHPVTDR